MNVEVRGPHCNSDQLKKMALAKEFDWQPLPEKPIPLGGTGALSLVDWPIELVRVPSWR